jgi:hypothetical protein
VHGFTLRYLDAVNPIDPAHDPHGIVIVQTDVTDWYVVTEWDARPESVNVIGTRLIDTLVASTDALPVLDGTWTVEDQNVDSTNEALWSELVAASPYKVDGVAEPLRGFAVSRKSSCLPRRTNGSETVA